MSSQVSNFFHFLCYSKFIYLAFKAYMKLTLRSKANIYNLQEICLCWNSNPSQLLGSVIDVATFSRFFAVDECESSVIPSTVDQDELPVLI